MKDKFPLPYIDKNIGVHAFKKKVHKWMHGCWMSTMTYKMCFAELQWLWTPEIKQEQKKEECFITERDQLKEVLLHSDREY